MLIKRKLRYKIRSITNTYKEYQYKNKKCNELVEEMKECLNTFNVLFKLYYCYCLNFPFLISKAISLSYNWIVKANTISIISICYRTRMKKGVQF